MNGPDDLTRLQNLLTSAGWEVLADWLDQSIQAELEGAVQAVDPFLAAKRLGAMAAFRTVKNWPQAVITALRATQES